MASIKLEWSNTTSQDPIVGYEIDYKLTSDISYIPLIDIVTSDTFGEYTWNGASYNTSYDFRIRTKDDNDDYSTYKFVSISTVVIGNLPPETVDSYDLVYVSGTEMVIEFFNASDDYGIKGHEVSYKKVSDSTYVILPFITTTNGDFTQLIDGLTPSTSYDIRVRTLDICDVWSTTYFNIVESTNVVGINSVQRSFLYVNHGSACSEGLSLNQLYYTGSISNGNIFYTTNTLTTPYDGDNGIWLVNNLDDSYSIRISGTGVMSEISLC